jgi:opacity protein-like surface antigen
MGSVLEQSGRATLLWIGIGVGVGVSVGVPTSALAATQVKPVIELQAESRYDGYDGDYAAGKQDLGANELYNKISPKLGADVGSETLKLQAWYAADIMYKALSATTGVDQRSDLKLTATPSDRVTIKGEGAFYRVQDPTSLPRLGVAQVNQEVLYSLVDLNISSRISQRWTWDVANRFELEQIYNIGQPLTLTESPATGLRYAVTARLNLGARYRYQSFVGMPDVVGQAHTAFFTGDYRLSATWTARLQVGPALYVGRLVGNTNTVPVGEGAIEHQGEYSELGVVVGHDLVGSLGYATAAWADYAQAIWAWHPTKPWRLHVDAGAFRNGLAPDQPSGFVGYSVGGGVSYSLTDELRVELAAQRISQVATGGNVDLLAVNVNRDIAAVRLAWAPAFEPREW